jgi:hypothetical protein
MFHNPSKSIFSNVEKCEHYVLKVMTLIIIIHCVQNLIPIDLTIVKMLKAKEDLGEAMVFNPNAKPHENHQIRIITKA